VHSSFEVAASGQKIDQFQIHGQAPERLHGPVAGNLPGQAQGFDSEDEEDGYYGGADCRREAPIDLENLTHGVYLAKIGARYKIGITGNLHQRLTQLSRRGMPAELIWKADGDRWAEIFIQLAFLEKRDKGEYFYLSDEDVELIKALPRQVRELGQLTDEIVSRASRTIDLLGVQHRIHFGRATTPQLCAILRIKGVGERLAKHFGKGSSVWVG
jgi:hypothetical protein